MLYSHAKQADKECKNIGAHARSRMLAAAGWAVQYANEEFRCWKNHEFIEPGETNKSAFTQAKQNWADAYTQIHQIQVRSQELREVDLQLMAEEQAKEQNTSVANALKAILKRERDLGIFPPFLNWINGPKLDWSTNSGLPTTPWTSKIPLGQQ